MYNGGMAFIRKFETASGATGVQVCWKQGGRVVRTEHIGSANSEVALVKLLDKAREVIRGKDQKALFDLEKLKKQ
jgi:hypothetical protein